MVDGGVSCCGCVVVIAAVAVFFVIIVPAKLAYDDIQNDRARRRAEEAENARIAETNRIQASKDDKIRTFALKEAPMVWEMYQSLQGEIKVQHEKIEELHKSLESFGRQPEQDQDYIRIRAICDEMVRASRALRSKLEDAYLAAKKYEASPSRKEYQELQRKALEDGMIEADAAAAKFKEMRLNK